ncbi:MAG: energy-coupling factor transporter transmembrane component T family protein [Actinomycetes bacterium]
MTAVDLLAGTDVDRSAPLARANPVAKLAVSVAVSLALLLTVDVVTAGTALLLELAALPWCGLGRRSLLRRGWIVLLAALLTGLATTWLGVDSGAVLLGLGPVTVTQGSLLAGTAIALRVLAIGLPGVVLLATTDPTDLADALAQVLRLPHRFVLAALAATRLFAVLAEEWQALSLARRARGVGDDGWLGRVRTLTGQTFSLLVLSIRRATTLATAMEARGFGVSSHRTWARPSRFGAGDWLVVLGGLVLCAAATTAGVLAGTWHLTLA